MRDAENPQVGDVLCDMHDHFQFLPKQWEVADRFSFDCADGARIIEGIWKTYGLEKRYTNKLLVVVGEYHRQPGELLRCAYSYDGRRLEFVALRRQEAPAPLPSMRNRPLIPCKTFRVPVTKDYANKSTRVTVDGYIEVDALSAEDALRRFKKLLAPSHSCLQTTDPRIRWDWEGAGWTEEEISAKGLEYVDHTFGRAGEPEEAA